MYYSVLCVWQDTVSSCEPLSDDSLNSETPTAEDIIHINQSQGLEALNDDASSICIVKECSINGEILDLSIISELSGNLLIDADSHSTDDSSVQTQVISYEYIAVIQLDAVLAKLVMDQLRVSYIFQTGFYGYVKQQCVMLQCMCQLQCGHIRPADCTLSIVPQLVVIRLNWPHTYMLDYKWNYRVAGLVMKAIQLDDAMNWLNTLGGGYSALGDHSTIHAEQAGRISFSQLTIALEMGDPATAIRCHLYYSLSLMQTRRLSQAKYIIRRCYREAQHLMISDHRLLAMCRGIWSRLKYLYSHKTS